MGPMISKRIAPIYPPTGRIGSRGLRIEGVIAYLFLPSKYSSISSSVLPLVSGRKNAAVTK